MQALTLRVLASGPIPSDLVHVHLGSWSIQAPVARGEGELWLPPAVYDRFPLTPGQRVGMWEDPEREHIHLGPLVGVIVEGPEHWDVTEMVDDRLRLLVEGARQAHVPVLFFSINAIDLRQKSVLAYTDRGAGRWQRCLAPLPDVMYNRGTYPDPEERGAARETRRVLRKVLEIPFITAPAGFGKWDTYKALAFFPHARPLCPETIQFGDEASFRDLLSRHQAVFVKADDGSHGEDVVRVLAPQDRYSSYELRGYLQGEKARESFRSAGGVYDFLAGACRHGDWLVQQAIDLLTYEGRRFDFRVILQKDEAGTWQMPHLLVRRAMGSGVVTNTSRGGESTTLEEFTARAGQEIEALPSLGAKIEEMSRLAAAAMEARYGLLGELGLDVGVDHNLRPWLLEVNTKPFFDPGEGSYLPFAYAKGLALKAWTATSSQWSRRPATVEPALVP